MATIDYDSLTTFEYASGDLPKPPTNKNYLRFYGHNLCPFVERAALALTAKGIPFQYVIMDLSNAAQWHKDVNGGAVPLLENTDGKIYCESAHIVEFAEEFYKGKGFQLFPSDPFKKLEMRIFNEAFQKYFGLFYGVFLSKGKSEEAILKLIEVIPEMEKYIADNLHGKPFLLGSDNLTYADLCCLGILTKIANFKGTSFNHIYERLNLEKNWPATLLWIQRVRSIEQLQGVLLNIPAWKKLIDGYTSAPEGVRFRLTLGLLK